MHQLVLTAKEKMEQAYLNLTNGNGKYDVMLSNALEDIFQDVVNSLDKDGGLDAVELKNIMTSTKAIIDFAVNAIDNYKFNLTMPHSKKVIGVFSHLLNTLKACAGSPDIFCILFEIPSMFKEGKFLSTKYWETVLQYATKEVYENDSLNNVTEYLNTWKEERELGCMNTEMFDEVYEMDIQNKFVYDIEIPSGSIPDYVLN